MKSKIKSEYLQDIETLLDSNKLIDMYNIQETNLKCKLNIIRVLAHLGFINDANKLFSQTKSIYTKEIYDYYLFYSISYILAKYENNEFTMRTLINRMEENFPENPKYIFEYSMAKNQEELNHIYNNFILPDIVNRFKNDNFIQDFFFASYFQDLYLNNNKSLKIVEKRFQKRITLLKSKKEIDINDIIFLKNISNVILNFSKINSSNSKLFNMIETMSLAEKIFRKSFLSFDESVRNEYASIVFSLNELLFQITDNQNYIDQNIKFFTKHESIMSEYYKYYFNYTPNRNKQFNELFSSFYKNEDILEFTNLFLMDFSIRRWSELKDEIDSLNLSGKEKMDNTLNNLILFAEFINGLILIPNQLKDINVTLNLPKEFHYIVDYENGIIEADNFLTYLRGISSMEVTTGGAKRILKAFYKPFHYNIIYELLIKLNAKYLDKQEVYCDILLKIINDNIIMRFHEFDGLVNDNVINSGFITRNCILIIALKFEAYSEKYYNIMKMNLDFIMTNKLLNEEDYMRIIFNYMYFYIQYNKRDDSIEKIFYSIVLDNIQISDDRNLLLLLLSNINPYVFENDYLNILQLLIKLKNLPISEWNNTQKKIIGFLFIRELEIPSKEIATIDRLYIDSSNRYYGYNKKLLEYYSIMNVHLIEEKPDNVETQVLSFINMFISNFAFSNNTEFGMQSISIPENANGKEIIEILSKQKSVMDSENDIKRLINGNHHIPIFQSFGLDRYFKTIQQLFDGTLCSKLFRDLNNDKIFSNNKKLIHPTSLILLSSLDALEIVVLNDLCFINESIFTDINNKFAFQPIELTDIFNENEIFIEDNVNRLAKNLTNIYDKNRIIMLPVGSGFSNKIDNKFNPYDRDIIITLSNKSPNNQFYLITDDSFFHKTMKDFTTGTYTLVIEAFSKDIIDSKKLLLITNKLYEIGYSSLFSPNIFYTLLNKRDKDNSSYINKVLTILNESTNAID